MTQCNAEPIGFSRLGRKNVVADFAGGLLLREADRRLGLTRALADMISDPRDPALITHAQRTMITQRVIGIALGYEDLNDHQTLRHDPLLQTLSEKTPDAEEPLASPPTLCRLENRVGRKALARMSEVLVWSSPTSGPSHSIRCGRRGRSVQWRYQDSEYENFWARMISSSKPKASDSESDAFAVCRRSGTPTRV